MSMPAIITNKPFATAEATALCANGGVATATLVAFRKLPRRSTKVQAVITSMKAALHKQWIGRRKLRRVATAIRKSTGTC